MASIGELVFCLKKMLPNLLVLYPAILTFSFLSNLQHVACRFGDDDEVIRLLVDAFPASLKVKTLKGNTPLSCAKKVVDRKHEHVVELLENMIKEGSQRAQKDAAT